jgi:hypothetical protein
MILNTLPFNYPEIRKNYSYTNSLFIYDFICAQQFEELKNRYSMLIKKVNEKSSDTNDIVKAFQIYVNNNGAVIPYTLKDFIRDNLNKAWQLSQLAAKETTFQRWIENHGRTNNELRKSELVQKIVRISEEIKNLKAIKLDAFPY